MATSNITPLNVWEVLDVVQNALDNFSHGRRVFAMQQLEALTEYAKGDTIAPSVWLEWLEGRCLMPRGHSTDPEA